MTCRSLPSKAIKLINYLINIIMFITGEYIFLESIPGLHEKKP